jgi:bloom syndrome protein
VKKDVVRILKMKDSQIFQQSFKRPNLIYEVTPKPFRDSSISFISRWIIQNNYKESSGLIFYLSRPETEKISQQLNQLSLKT